MDLGLVLLSGTAAGFLASSAVVVAKDRKVFWWHSRRFGLRYSLLLISGYGREVTVWLYLTLSEQ